MYRQVCIFMYVHVFVCMHVYECICIRACMYPCVYVHVCLYVPLLVPLYLLDNKHFWIELNWIWIDNLPRILQNFQIFFFVKVTKPIQVRSTIIRHCSGARHEIHVNMSMSQNWGGINPMPAASGNSGPVLVHYGMSTGIFNKRHHS